MSIQLRDYQIEKMVKPAVKQFKNGHKDIVIVAPTGSGKTAVACHWAKEISDKDKNVLSLVHKSTILNQFSKTAFSAGLQSGVIASGKPVTTENSQIAMVGTLKNKLDLIPTPDIILGDEVHHFRKKNMWGFVVDYYKKKNPDLLTLGFTATPNGRTDGLGLHPFFSYMVDELTIKHLVSNGWLVYPHTMRGERVDPFFHIKGGDYDKEEQTKHAKKPKIIGNVIENYQQYLDGMPTLVSCSSLDHAYFMAEQYNKAAKEKGKSWKAVMIQGGKRYEKQMIDALDGLATGAVQIVTFVDVIGEGVDVPVCMGLQMCRKVRSYVLYKQFIGRVLRPYWPEWFNPNTATKEERLKVIFESIKPKAEIQDFMGNTTEHGHPVFDPQWSLLDDKVFKNNTEITQPETTICQKCGGCFEGLLHSCPDCGFNIDNHRLKQEGKKTPEEIEGILKEVNDFQTEAERKAFSEQSNAMQQMTPEQRRKAMLQNLRKHGPDSDRIKALQKINGYHGKWAEKVYKRIYRG